MSKFPTKEAAHDHFEVVQAEWLEQARKMAIGIAKLRGKVDIEDVRRACPLPSGCHPNVMGAVFKTGDFLRIGYKMATRPSAHQRVIGEYALRSY